MAYKRSKGKLARRKQQRVPLTLTFFSSGTVAAGTTETFFVDLSLAASIVNRRGYKQEYGDWAVSSIKFTGSYPGNITLSTAPSTWMATNAYRKARSMWYEMNKQVTDSNEAIVGKYQDFKVYLDSDMAQANIQQLDAAGVPTPGTILTPVDSLGNHTTGDYTDANSPKADWDYSTIQVPNDPVSGTTQEYGLHITGASGVTMGIIQGYGLSRARPQLDEPNTPGATSSSDWMTALFDDGENFEEIKHDLIDDNDRPPYAVGSPGGASEFYPGGANELPGNEIIDVIKMTGNYSGSGLSQGSSCPFMARHGLIRIDFTNVGDNAQNVGFQVRLVPGNNRGYMCEAV